MPCAMGLLDRIPTATGKRDKDTILNLAVEMIQDEELVMEALSATRSDDGRIQGDVAELFAEAAKEHPELVAEYVYELLPLLESEHNRALWEGLAAMSRIATLRPAELYARRLRILEHATTGSVIVVDGAVKTLAGVASTSEEYSADITPDLLQILRKCPGKDIPRIAEYILPAVRGSDAFASEMREILKRRQRSVKSAAGKARVRKIVVRLS